MIHSLLLVLKIIGIILLVLLGIIVTLLLLLLFIPIRYQIDGCKKEESIVKCKVKWLFGFLSFVFLYENKEHCTRLCILGIDLLKFIKRIKQKKKDSMDKQKKKEDTNIESEEENTISERLSAREENKVMDTAESHDKKQGVTEKSKKRKKNKKTFGEKIRAIPSSIKEKIQKIKLTIINIYDKIEYWKKVLSDERTKGALQFVIKQLIKLLKHIFPKKVQGEIAFGFEDPYTTGQVLAGAAIVYPWYAGHVQLYPDFNRQVLEGTLNLKGRLYLCYILKITLVLFFNKNVQHIIHIFRTKEGS